MRTAIALLPLLLLLGGCPAGGGDVGYAVRLIMVIDPSIPDADKDRIRTLELEVQASAETWYERIPEDGRFRGRRAEMIYRPKIPSGRLPVQVRVRDDKDALIGEGAAVADLVPGRTVDLTITIARPGVADLGGIPDLLSGPDFALPVDMAMPPPPPRDMATPPPPADMSMPPPPPADMSMPPPPPDLSITDA